MSVGHVHLTEEEKRDLAQGLLEHGSAVEHLEECDSCAAEVEQLSAEEERRLYAAPASNASPEWLRAAALKELDELEPKRAAGPQSNPRVSGRWTIRPAENENAVRKAGSLRLGGPNALVGAGSAIALAAAVVLFVKSREDVSPRAYEKAGGVSAELFCAEPGGAPVILGATDATCARGASLLVRAVPAPENRLPFFTIVACDRDRCEGISRSRFAGEPELTATGPVMGTTERVDVILIWSDRELSDDFLAVSAKSRSRDAGVPSLSLPSSWAQVGFAVRSR